jgi:hypothetical protein
MADTEYVIVLGGNFRPLRERFHELGGYYNGLGYVFPKEKEEILRTMVSHIPGSVLVKPSLDGKSFEAMREDSTVSFLRTRLYGVERQLWPFCAERSLPLEELSREEIESSELLEPNKSELLALIDERQKIKSGIDWHEGIEKALSQCPSRDFQLKFLDEYNNVHYLLDDAPEMSSLVNRLNEHKKTVSLIPRGILGMIVSAGGVGKTHILTQLGLVVATGGKWLGEFDVERPGNVFLGLGENSEEDIHRLLRKTSKSLCLSVEECIGAGRRLSVMSFLGTPSSFIHKNRPTDLFQSLLESLKTKEPSDGWSLIILDPISRFAGAFAETDNASATELIALLERLSLGLRGRPTVLFGHHMNKTGIGNLSTDQGASRGSSALTDGVRLQINLDRGERRENEPETVTLRVVKSNFTAIPLPMTLIKDSVGCLRKRPEKRLLEKSCASMPYG